MIRTTAYLIAMFCFVFQDVGWRFSVVSCLQAPANRVLALKEVIISQREGKL